MAKGARRQKTVGQFGATMIQPAVTNTIFAASGCLPRPEASVGDFPRPALLRHCAAFGSRAGIRNAFS